LDRAQVHRKLEEACLFLGKMTERERQLLGEPFDCYLSAFLTAAMSVRDPFRDKSIKAWRESWEKTLAPDENYLYKAMREGRIAENHIARKARTSFKLCVGHEEIRVGVGSSYSDRSGTVEAFGSPSCLLGTDTAVVIRKPTYYLTIDGAERGATEACAAYLALLQRMVAQFEADYP